MSNAGADDLRKELLALFGRLTDGPLTLEAGLTASATVRHGLDALQVELVGLARDEGASWASIGAALGVTTQAAHQRFALGQDGEMTDRSSPVSEIMQTDFLVLGPDDPVEGAMRALIDHNVEAAPVASADGTLVGVLSNTDLIVQESQLHFPTVLSVLGASIEIGHKHFQEDLTKALGSKVSEVMSDHPISCEETDTVESAATVMHDKDIGHLPVVRAGRVVGMVSRNDLLRAVLSGP